MFSYLLPMPSPPLSGHPANRGSKLRCLQRLVRNLRRFGLKQVEDEVRCNQKRDIQDSRKHILRLLKLILSNIFIIHLLIELYILAFNAAVFSTSAFSTRMRSGCCRNRENRRVFRPGGKTGCGGAGISCPSLSKMTSDLKHFGIATVEQQRDAVAVFRQLSDKPFDKGRQYGGLSHTRPSHFRDNPSMSVIHDPASAVGHNGWTGAQGSRSNLPNAFSTSFGVYHSSDDGLIFQIVYS